MLFKMLPLAIESLELHAISRIEEVTIDIRRDPIQVMGEKAIQEFLEVLELSSQVRLPDYEIDYETCKPGICLPQTAACLGIFTVFCIALFASNDSELMQIKPTAEEVLCVLEDICNKGSLELYCPSASEPEKWQPFRFWNLGLTKPKIGRAHV